MRARKFQSAPPVTMRFRLAAFILHGDVTLCRFQICNLRSQITEGAVELDDVALAGDAVRKRTHGKNAGDPHLCLAFVRTFVGFFVEHLPLRRELVLRPHLLQMDQATLARTKQPMLKRGKREELFFGEHGIREMG